MTTEQKIIRAKVGLLELAKQLGNVSQACKMMGYSRDSLASRPIARCRNDRDADRSETHLPSPPSCRSRAVLAWELT